MSEEATSGILSKEDDHTTAAPEDADTAAAGGNDERVAMMSDNKVEEEKKEEKDDEEEEDEEEDDFDIDALNQVKAGGRQHLSSDGSTGSTSGNSASTNMFVMGNKARSGGRDTQFFQVLNVSETWHRNHTLSRKEDQKLLDTAELLNETLTGWGYVYVEIYDFYNQQQNEYTDTKYTVRIKEGESTRVLREKIGELVQVQDLDRLDLFCNDNLLGDGMDVVSALKKFGGGRTWPTPYFGLVWVQPK